MNVLIVDDSAAVRERLTSLLEENEQIKVVACADSALDAVEKFDKLNAGEDRLDAVILDIQLGVGNGIGVLRYIKSRSPQTKVIMLTNHATRQYRNMSEIADYFFDKTTEFMRVQEVLQSAIALDGKFDKDANR
ncbi:MAG: response regulator transcription factor [Sulfuricellaceae bacterium]|nr:response regulator transcription factor [Sulfuricellaceae bacterium]